MNEVSVMRSPEIIAAEINGIKQNFRLIMLQTSVEIGRRLVEAKEQLPYGTWGKWLEEQVDYSHSTANNLMALYNEYGDKIASIGNLNVAELPYTKALALLDVPAEDREQFVQEHDIENMSASKIKAAIREKEEAEERAKTAEAAAEQERQAAEQEREKRKKLEDKALYNATEVERLKAELKEAKESGSVEDVQRLQQSLEESENDLIDARNKIKALEKQVKEKPIATVEVEKVPEEMQVELEVLRKKLSQIGDSEAAIKFKVCFESLGNRFNELMDSLAEIPEADRPKYQTAVKKMLINLTDSIA